MTKLGDRAWSGMEFAVFASVSEQDLNANVRRISRRFSNFNRQIWAIDDLVKKVRHYCVYRQCRSVRVITEYRSQNTDYR